jgi:toxin HigB-1
LTDVARHATSGFVIRSFRHKGLAELWATGKSAAVPANLRGRVLNRLTVLNAAKTLGELKGFRTHPWKGDQSGRYGMDVNGPWRITFEFREQDAYLVDLEQPH